MTDFVMRLEAVVYDRPHLRDVFVRLKDRQHGEHFDFVYTYEKVAFTRGMDSIRAHQQIGQLARLDLLKQWSPQP